MRVASILATLGAASLLLAAQAVLAASTALFVVKLVLGAACGAASGLLAAGCGLGARLKNEKSDMAGIIACSAGALAGPDSAAQGEI